MKYDTDTISGLAELDLSPLDRRLYAKKLHELVSEFRAHLAEKSRIDSFERGALAANFSEFLIERIRIRLERIVNLRYLEEEFNSRLSRSLSESERRQHILDLAKRLGASPSQLRDDQKAFSRWFGYDTVLERLNREINGCEYEIVLALGRLGISCAVALQEASDFRAKQRLWGRENLEAALRPLLVYRGDARVTIEAFKSLARAVAALPSEARKDCLDSGTSALIYRSALDSSQHLWIQCEALKLLSHLDPDSFFQVLARRLGQPKQGDDIFFRRRAVALVGEHIHSMGSLVEFIPRAMSDPSPYVRQELAPTLTKALEMTSPVFSQEEAWGWLSELILADSSPQVRAAAIIELPRLALSISHDRIADLLACLFSREVDPFVLRTGLEAAFDAVELLRAHDLGYRCAGLYVAILPAIEELHQSASDLSVRRWAALAREKMFVAKDARAAALKQQLEEALSGLEPGKSRRIRKSILGNVDQETFGRVLSVMSQADFGLSVDRGFWGLRITRGDVFGFRFWRFFHELLTPLPDKRQGFRHTVGRKTTGFIKAPSSIGSEMTQTKVPGEPLHMLSEAGWRPYLPLLDDVLSSLSGFRRAKSIKFFSAEGVTELQAPRSIFRRIVAYFVLTFKFARYAELRNWSEEAPTAPDTYVRALERLGFRLSNKEFTTDEKAITGDRSVARFFALGVPLLSSDTWQRFKDYFMSAYENSLYELGLFAAGLLVLFVGARAYLGWAVRRARKSFSLVIGGWGTRGKSGVERLKTALIEALGHSVVAKTTGCEAMFLHSYPFGKTREMLIYRSYDKATIWEHHSIMVLARKLGCEVFLWECMGLNPSFVRILQRQWAVDDYSTITNTYPDHEDIQGPAGINIPEVMTNFIPRRSVLITSEQEMKPVLAQAARELESRLESVGWLEAGLLTPEVMARFPYEEHPNNVALVLALARDLGVAQDFAIKEMAERVVPDLGVLKSFPAAEVDSRHLEFINGMSANERFAALGNWSRMGFDLVEPETHPGTLITTVVNNRADRTSRSRMFAEILVNDVSADRHFLIGSNLQGLLRYVNDAWDDFIRGVTLFPKDQREGRSSLSILDAMARRLRIPTSADLLKKRLRAILDGLEGGFDREELSGLWNEPDRLAERLHGLGLGHLAQEVAAHIRDQLSLHREFEDFRARVESPHQDGQKELDNDFKSASRKWFMGKFVVIEDYDAIGEQIIDRIIRETPPGLVNRIMGMQNIKGTGLDFVYRWQAWDICYHTCNSLVTEDSPEVFEEILKELAAFDGYGLLSENHVKRTLETVRLRRIAQTERFQAQIAIIESNMNQALSRVRAQLTKSGAQSAAIKLLNYVEAFLEAGDSIRRRKTANLIYKDLVNSRISHDRAAAELKNIYKRQTGGWLAARLGMRLQ
jgi:gamma-polyglutamate synthase